MSRILVVDDEEMMRKLLPMILGDGYDVSVAGSVAEAIRLLNQKPHDVIVSDIKMPGEDGLTLLSKLRERDSDIPVILMTGHGDKQTAIAALRAGAFDFIEKPFEDEEMVFAVERALKHRFLEVSRELAMSSLRKRILEVEKLAGIQSSEDLPVRVSREVQGTLEVIDQKAIQILEALRAHPTNLEAIREMAEAIQKGVRHLFDAQSVK